MPCCAAHSGVACLHTNTGLEYLCVSILHVLGQAEISVEEKSSSFGV